MTRPLAAVTGATGFLGRWLVPELDRAGLRVRALCRRDPVHALWTGLEPEIVAGGLSDPAALAALVQGATVVVHGAGLIKARSRKKFFAVNAGGAEAVARATLAHAAPAARFVLISSLAAREPRLSAYAASKRAGEEAVTALIPPERLTVVRPSAVYGPWDIETLAIFRAAARAPILPLLGDDAARLAVTHVEDAAAQIAWLAARPGGWGTVPLPGHAPAGYGWRALVDAAVAAVGRTDAPRRLRVPGWALQAVAGPASVGARLVGARPMLTPGKARELLHADWSVDVAALPAGLPAARVPLSEGFAATASWYRARGWL